MSFFKKGLGELFRRKAAKTYGSALFRISDFHDDFTRVCLNLEGFPSVSVQSFTLDEGMMAERPDAAYFNHQDAAIVTNMALVVNSRLSTQLRGFQKLDVMRMSGKIEKCRDTLSDLGKIPQLVKAFHTVTTDAVLRGHADRLVYFALFRGLLEPPPQESEALRTHPRAPWLRLVVSN